MLIMTMVMLDRRYASLPNIMKAKKKPMEKKKLSDYNIEFKRRLEIVGVTGISTTNITQPPPSTTLLFSSASSDNKGYGMVEPPPRVGGGKVDSVDGLIAKLKELGAI